MTLESGGKRLSWMALLFFLQLSIHGTESANVLIYNPTLGFYHVKFMTTIANELEKAGHNVTMLDSIVNSDLPTAKRRDGIKSVRVGQNAITREILHNGDTMDSGLKAFWQEIDGSKKFWGIFGLNWRHNNFSTMLSSQCEDIVRSPLLTILNETKFDLAITELFDFCGLGIFDMLKPARTLLVSSIPLHDTLGEKLGLPTTFDLVPPLFTLSTLGSYRISFEEMSRKDHIQSGIESTLWGGNMFMWLEEDEGAIFKSRNKDFPGFESLIRSSHFLLENVHPLIDLIKPTLNSIVPIGGITVEKPKEIPKDLDTLMLRAGERKRVFVSFGTVMGAKTMSNKTRSNLIWSLGNVSDAMFYWKADRSLLKDIELPPNVVVVDWLPQNDLLASGLIDLFVSHMGIGSLSEAAYSGVPMVSVPIFVDQHYNYICALRLGIARFADKSWMQLNDGQLQKVIEAALVDEKMKTRSMELKGRLYLYGDQKRRMMEVINYTLSLPPFTPSLSFFNHYHGFSAATTIRSMIAILLPTHVTKLVFVTSLSFLVFLLIIIDSFLLNSQRNLSILTLITVHIFTYPAYFIFERFHKGLLLLLCGTISFSSCHFLSNGIPSYSPSISAIPLYAILSIITILSFCFLRYLLNRNREVSWLNNTVIDFIVSFVTLAISYALFSHSNIECTKH